MTGKKIEWNLAFSPSEVIQRLEKLFEQHAYTYTAEDQDSDRYYHTALGQGRLKLIMHPLEPKRSPFSPTLLIQRTLLCITCTDVSEDDQAVFKHQLTMAFLRVGG